MVTNNRNVFTSHRTCFSARTWFIHRATNVMTHHLLLTCSVVQSTDEWPFASFVWHDPLLPAQCQEIRFRTEVSTVLVTTREWTVFSCIVSSLVHQWSVLCRMMLKLSLYASLSSWNDVVNVVLLKLLFSGEERSYRVSCNAAVKLVSYWDSSSVVNPTVLHCYLFHKCENIRDKKTWT